MEFLPPPIFYLLPLAHHQRSLVPRPLVKMDAFSASRRRLAEDAVKLPDTVLNNIWYLMALAVGAFCIYVCQINSLDHKFIFIEEIHFYAQFLGFFFIMNRGYLSLNILPVSVEIDILLSVYSVHGVGEL